jgi:8-oxo-dGTP pyrophosphatase MutT (NUDIX family)
VIRPGEEGWEALLLQRAAETRCPGAWETIHGRIEPDERPVDAALRELEEETGLVPERLYNLSRTESFYLHRTDEVALIPVFAAVVARQAAVRLSAEHQGFEWKGLGDAAQSYAWPRERRAIQDLALLLGQGNAGSLEDVLRII